MEDEDVEDEGGGVELELGSGEEEVGVRLRALIYRKQSSSGGKMEMKKLR